MLKSMLACSAAVLLAASPAVAQDDILAVSWGGNSYTIDSSTGSGSLLGPAGFGALNSMAKDAAGVFWTMSSDDLLTVNPATGAASFVVTVSGGINSVRGMAWLGGRLFVVQDGGSTSDPDELYTVDSSTGTSTLIGIMNYRNIQGLAANAGTLYAWSIGDGLLTVNTATGFATDVNAGVGADFDIQTIAFNAAGRLYGCRDSLYTINPATGVQSLVGTGGYSDVRGMEFLGAQDRLNIDPVGNCPGFMQFFVTNCTPGGNVGLLFAFCDTGSVVPSGVCAGTALDLCNVGLQLAQVQVADAGGVAVFSGNVPPVACQGFVEAIDASTCATSPAVPIP